jgi:hypothetical protein
MNISLKNTRINHQDSEETLAFNALLCIDGNPFAEVSNDGRGGENRYRPLGDSMDWIYNHALVTQFREWCSIQPPVYDRETGNTYKFDADIYVNDCLTEHVGKFESIAVSI